MGAPAGPPDSSRPGGRTRRLPSPRSPHPERGPADVADPDVELATSPAHGARGPGFCPGARARPERDPSGSLVSTARTPLPCGQEET